MAINEDKLDLDVALQEMNRLGLEGGDLGYLYWYRVGELLKAASTQKETIRRLEQELQESRAIVAELRKQF